MAGIVRALVHKALYRHYWLEKEGVGDVLVCGGRLSQETHKVWFRPAYDNAPFYEVENEAMLHAVVRSATPMEAMSAIRNHTEKGTDHA